MIIARSSPTLLRLFADGVAIFGAGVGAIFIRFSLGWFELTESTQVTARSHIGPALVWTGALLLALSAERLYDEDALVVGSGELQRVWRAVLITSGTFGLLIFITQSFFASRAWLALTIFLSLLFLWLERGAIRRFIRARRKRGHWKRPIVLVRRDVDANSDAPDIDEFEIIVTVDLEGLHEYLEHARRGHRPHLALMVMDRDFDRNQMWSVVLDAGRKGLSAYLLSPVRSVRRDRLTVREMAGNTLVKVAPPGLHGWQALQKRALDIVGSVLGLIITAPLLLITAVAVLLTSGRPVLYRQQRKGTEGRLFEIIKIRTMRGDAEAEGPVWSRDRDDRVTSVGGLLRRLGVDELPQLWNVFKGDMSLVGPRPERPEFVEQFSADVEWYAYRDRIRPGITGWSQAHGLRGDTSLEARVEFDNWYIENWSLLLDIRIMFATIGELIRGQRPGEEANP